MIMKKSIILSILLAVGLSLFAQQAAPQWHNILGGQPETYRTQLISSSESSIQVNVQVPGFYTASVTTPRGEAQVVTLPKAVSTAQAGEPDMPMTGIPVLIGDKARMSIRVIDAQYRDFEGIEVAPSKGDFPRTINPDDVPYTYGECYNQDAFFPANNVGLYEPYIIRNFRGQNMVLYPFAYNPATKTLRVYYDMTVEMYKVDNNGSNTIETRRSNVVKMDPDFKSVYQRHFINYEAAMGRYTPLDEEGDLLIICYDNFISSMTDFVNWKKTRGMNTTIVGTSTAGSTYSAIKSYIQSQYNANNNLTHVLLVGDVAQIPGYSYSGGGSSYSGLGDNAYGQIVGSDIYNDVFIGRFSASSAAQVTTQVNRIITYERDLTTSATWCQNGLGISTTEGSGGHNNEDDYQHIENLRTDLLNYGYSTVYQDYYNVSGYPTSSCTTISNHINSGVGIINYCNHGQETGWQSHSPYYTNTYVNALTNDNKLPFIFSVACLVGKYDYSSGDCFGETWMHATNGSNPTGAIGGMFSYISQPWIPPMWAQDEFVDILCELKSNNIKRTLGGAAVNGLFAIFDNYSTTNQSAVGTYQAWVLYGDPTLMLRTKTPQAMTVTHTGSITTGATSYSVTVNNGSGAVATITDADHNILGKATVSGTTANISINGTLTAGTELTLCVFGYNKVTYLGTITVVGGTQYSITCNPTLHGSISAPEQSYANTTVTLTASPETGYCLSAWDVRDVNNNVIAVNNNQFTMPESNVTVSATFVEGYTVTLAAVQNGSISATPTCALPGTTINLEAIPTSGYAFDSWHVFETENASNTVTVTDNNFTMPDYDVTVSASFVLNPQYVKVTSSLSDWSGEYLIVYENGNVAFNGGLTSLDVTGNTISVTIADNAIDCNATTEAAQFTIEKSGDEYTIKSASGYYIGRTTNSNGMNTSTSQAYTNTISYSDNSVSIHGSYCYLRYNSSSNNGKRFRYYTSSTSQKAIQLYKKVNPEVATYTITFNANGGSGSMEPQIVNELEPTMLMANAFTRDGYDFVGWNTSADGSGDHYADQASVALSDDLTLYAQWSEPVAVNYQLVTSADELQAGRHYLIVNVANNKALGTTQNNNNRSAEEVTITNNVINSIDNTICELTLGGTTGAWTFFDSNWGDNGGYLYAASSTKNYLRTQEENNANGQWSIEITSEGVATITAQGTNTHNLMRYNSSNDLFACYTGGQQDVYLFAEIETFELSQGSNWWTPTKAMTLEQLEAALGSNAVLINSQDAGFARYEGGQWSGTLTEIVPGQMYKIETTDAVSLTLSGAPATGVSLTILTGYNWFGYTGAQAAEIATALGDLGVTPANDDTITDKDGHTATFNGSSWNGEFTELQPGHGYVYCRQ